MWSQEGLLDLENEEYVVFISYLCPVCSVSAPLRQDRTQLLCAPALLFILEYLSTGDRLQLRSRGPIYLLPQNYIKIEHFRTSLVAQWLRICLPMQGTRVPALVQEDPTCRRATRPVSHNY